MNTKTQPVASDLLPCPFCGHDTPEFVRIGTPGQSCIVECGYCGCRHESSDEGGLSGTSWNTRAEQPVASEPSSGERAKLIYWLRERSMWDGMLPLKDAADMLAAAQPPSDAKPASEQEDEYFSKRPQIDCNDRRVVFRAGFAAGRDSEPELSDAPKAGINCMSAWPFKTQPVASEPSSGCREDRMVVLKRDEHGTPTVWCDPEIADLVGALNSNGIATVASCSGHGGPFGNIALRDGRELLVIPDFESARKAEKAIASEPVAVPQGWQPIETAPKNLKKILLWCVNAYVHNHVKTGFVDPEGDAWSVFDDGEAAGHIKEEFATHWMPLPAVPSPAHVGINGLTEAETNASDSLYWRLHSLSTSLESSGRIDEHDMPEAYATILGAMLLAARSIRKDVP